MSQLNPPRSGGGGSAGVAMPLNSSGAGVAMPPPPSQIKEKKRSIILLKVPDYVYNALEASMKSMTSESENIGTYEVDQSKPVKQPLKGSKPEAQPAKRFKFTLNETEHISAIPKKYLATNIRPYTSNLPDVPEPETTEGLVMEEKPDPKKFSTSAKVTLLTDKGELVAEMNDEYRRFFFNKTKEENTPKKHMIKEETTEKGHRIDFIAPVAQYPDAKVKKVKPPEQRAERDTKDNLVKKIFQLYAEQESYSLKELTAKTHQPMPFVKEVMSELCVKVKEGVMRYQLKPEYKTHAQRKENNNQNQPMDE